MDVTRSRKVTLLASVMVVAAGIEAAADVGPPVEIKMPLDTAQAVAGQEYAGIFRVHVFKPGILARFQISGEGWNVLSAETPAEPADVQAGVIEIPFRAVPTDADQPIGLSFTYDGRLVRRAYQIGPAYFARAGKPYRSVRVHDARRPTSDATDLGPAASSGSDGSADDFGTRFDGPLQVIGRIVYSRPGRDLSDPPDGDTNDPEDIPPVTVGLDNIDVQIWDSDTVGHETIWSGLTDENGYFDTGVVNWVDSGDDPDLVLYYETQVANVVDVTDNSVAEWTYTFESAEVTDFTGSFYNFGSHSPADAGLHPALHIFNSVVRTRRFIEEKPGYITPYVQVEWPDDSRGDAAWYDDFANELHISTPRQWRNDTVSHEYGHHFIDSLYVPDMPAPEYCIDPSCDTDNANGDCGHCMWCQETDHDAWNEGWPNWLADIVTRDYPNRYTHDVNGPEYVPLYTRRQEWAGTCGDSGMFEDPLKTEGFIGALLCDIEDATQDDHDDDPDPNVWTSDGVFDMMCLGVNEIFYVTATYQPVTITDFIAGFLAAYPQHTGDLWATAFNVGGAAYVTGFPADAAPPGVVPACDSSTHPLGTGGPFPCITFEWSPAPDDARGACSYSYVLDTNPAGTSPDLVADFVAPTDGCKLTTTVAAPGAAPGLYYFHIRAQDNVGKWSGQFATFGPFEIIDCNGSGILDLCDIDCNHTGIPGFCNLAAGACSGQPGCGASADCNGNFWPDECDIANGTSQDCNNNGVPDECENMFHWDAGSGSWHAGLNWLEGTQPTANAQVCIGVPGNQLVTYSNDASDVATLACSESLDIAGGTFPWADLTLNDASWVDGSLGLSGVNCALRVNDTLDITGLFDWTGSNLANSATLAGPGVTHANGGSQISGVVNLNDHTLELDGYSVSTGRIDFSGTPTLRIKPGATFEHQSAFSINSGWFNQLIDNDGTIVKTTDTGSSWINSFLDNSGEVRVEDGTLIIGRYSSSTGDFVGLPGATLEFRGGGHELLVGSSVVAEQVHFESGISGVNNVRGTYNVAIATTQSGQLLTFTNQASIVSYGSSFYIPKGTVNFDAVVGGTIPFNTLSLGTPISAAGTANFNSGDPVQVTNLIIGPGTITGSSDVTVANLLTWKASGHFYGPSALNVDGDMTVEGGGGAKSLYNRTLNNAGTATFLGPLGMSSSAAFNNLATGVIDIQADSGASIIGGSGVGGTSLNNAGTIVKTAGAGTSTISAPTTNSGIVEVQIGELEFYTYYGSYYTQTAGKTLLNGGDFAMFGSAPLQIDGGALAGEGLVTGNVVNAAGRLDPGFPAGTLDIDGNYTQAAAGVYKAQLAGPTQGVDYDWVNVTGNATLDGTLRVKRIGATVLSPGDSFEILTAAAVSGSFSNVVLVNIPSQLDVEIVYTATAVYVEFVAKLGFGPDNQFGGGDPIPFDPP